MPLPKTPAPPLEFELVDGTTFKLADAKPSTFTMVVFFRGYFCAVCSRYLPEIQAAADKFSELGVDVVLVSSDNLEHTRLIRDEWGIELPLGHSLDIETAKSWDLLFSEGDPARPAMPKVFNEPALYLIKPDGEIFYQSRSSSPIGRPAVDELLFWFDFMKDPNKRETRGGYLPSR